MNINYSDYFKKIYILSPTPTHPWLIHNLYISLFGKPHNFNYNIYTINYYNLIIPFANSFLYMKEKYINLYGHNVNIKIINALYFFFRKSLTD